MLITGGVEVITPDIAKKYLEMNGDNPRRINKNYVQQYAVDMATGNWKLNGEAIVFDSAGNLKDGQHRLAAVIRAKAEVPMMVIRGVDSRITTFDYGYRRSLKQEMNVSSAVEGVASMMVTNGYSITSIPKGLQADYINKHYEELKATEKIALTGMTHAKSKKRDVMTAIYVMLRTGVEREQLSAFFSVVNSGFQLDDRESSSAIVLAKYIDGLRSLKNRQAIFRNMEVVLSAYDDFANGIRRRKAYQIKDSARSNQMFKTVREMDGLRF